MLLILSLAVYCGGFFLAVHCIEATNLIASLYIVCFVFTEVTVKLKIGSEIYREQVSKCIISKICNYTAWNAPPYKT